MSNKRLLVRIIRFVSHIGSAYSVLPGTKCVSQVKRLDNAAGHSITYFLSKSSEIFSLERNELGELSKARS